jgi:UDP-glucose 4-epimerase
VTPSHVLITGAAGYLGSRLLERLAADRRVERLFALDLRPLAVVLPKVAAATRDVAWPLTDLFLSWRPQAVVHLAYLMRPGRDREKARQVNVEGTGRVLEACAAAGVRHVVYLSSTTVYGAHPDNPPALTEDDPPRPVKGFYYSEDKAAAEGLLRDFARHHPEVCVTLVRGCVVMGPGAANFITEALSKPLLVGVRGHDPPLQFLHQEDLLDLLLSLLERPVPGVFNAAGEGTVRWSEAVRLFGRRLLWLPAPLLYPLVEVAWRLHLQSDSPACGLDMVRWPWVVSTQKLQRETGFRPRYSSWDALQAFAMARKGAVSPS